MAQIAIAMAQIVITMPVGTIKIITTLAGEMSYSR